MKSESVTGFTSEWRPASFRNAGRDQIGIVTGKPPNIHMLGKVYRVQGFDKYGNVELEPKRLNTVWVESEFLKLRARKLNKRRAK